MSTGPRERTSCLSTVAAEVPATSASTASDAESTAPVGFLERLFVFRPRVVDAEATGRYGPYNDMATTQHSIRLVKAMPYRGDPAQQFSNRYYFDGGSPGDATAWHTLMDAIVLIEKTIYASSCKITDAFGYAPGSEVAVASKAYTTNGTAVTTDGAHVPGDCAAVCRWGTTKRSTKNHQVFVFSYWHRCMTSASAGTPDVLLPTQRTAMENYAQDWVDGITVAGRTYKRTTPDGAAVEGRLVEPWIGHRDFPR